jgi:rhodanese-related sulfurtransferase
MTSLEVQPNPIAALTHPTVNSRLSCCLPLWHSRLIMIRDRFKKVLRKAAIKALGMEEQAEDRKEQVHRDVAFDPKYMPKVVDGSGDTPGPNHRTKIGRTWLSAQVAGGVPPLIVDVRPPQEWTAGHIKGALLLPGRQILNRTDALPGLTDRVTVVDATGGALSEEVAAELRELGWGLARFLTGGWAEWVEYGEPESRPAPVEGAQFHLGSPVALPDGRHGQVQGLRKKGRGFSYDVLLSYDDNEVALDIPASKLKA